MIHFDAAALHRLDNDVLVPVASVGLSDDAMGRRFPIKDYPRLQIISRSRKPVVFPSDCALPDPFDGLLACDQGSFMRVHACLGCPLWVGDSLIGVFTADAAEPGKFEVAKVEHCFWMRLAIYRFLCNQSFCLRYNIARSSELVPPRSSGRMSV